MYRTYGYDLRYPIRNIITIRSYITTFLIISCFTAIYTIILSIKNEETSKEIINNAIVYVGKDVRYTDTYRKKEKLPKDLKFILLWTSSEYAPFYFYGTGQNAFIKNNCSNTNCFVTTEQDFLQNDLTRFDVILFNGRNFNRMSKPETRSPHQRYVYVNMESADNYPVCDKSFDDFFNWTHTYRLDSDIPTPYIEIRDKNNNVIGPKRDMHWNEMGANVFDIDLYTRWRNKTKAAAWFVSACSSRSNRTELALELKKALLPYDMDVYIYGKCGTLECPRQKHTDCAKMLESDYYFYLSFENSFAEDYVTEKVLNAVQHDTIPIVYGSANYSRFLPPGSYLDAYTQTPDELAAKMYAIIQSKKIYQNFFKWRQYYTYHNKISGQDSVNVCSLCEALNNDSVMKETKVYDNFREWWNPNYKQRCKG